MTAVATPPNFAHINKSAWNANPQSALNSMNADDVARMFVAPRKSVQRSNSSSSVSSASSASSTSTVSQSYPNMSPAAEDGPAKRKKSLRPGGWSSTKDDSALGSSATSIRAGQINGIAGSSVLTAMLPAPVVPSQHAQNGTQQQNGHRGMAAGATEGNPVLYLLSMNGTFERKTISVPYYPDSIRIGRQTNAKTAPTATNGFFDSKVLSRQHAEIWADRNGKVWIRDVKSSNGTFVNSFRLSAENKDSDPHELQTQDQLELGIDIVSEDQKTVVHHKVAAKVEHAGYLGSSNNVLDMNFGDLDPANGGLLLNHAGLTQRGRTGSQGSVGSRGTSVAASQMSMASHRPMSYWLSPVTTEQIAKRIAVGYWRFISGQD